MNILLIITGLIALLFIIAFFSSKEMNIEKSIVINQPKEKVFDYIKYMKNHENFNVWMQMDPDMKKELKGTDGQTGFVYAWDSDKKKNMGAGEQEIKKMVPNSTVEYEIRFFRPMQDVAKAVMTTSSSGNQTLVNWGFYSSMKFPMNIMKPMIQNMLGNNLVTGLENLKSTLEK